MTNNGLMSDREFVRMLPMTAFAEDVGNVGLSNMDELVLTKAASMRRRELVTVQYREHRHVVGGCFIDIELTALGRQTFRRAGLALKADPGPEPQSQAEAANAE